jgi:hypothetical protein
MREARWEDPTGDENLQPLEAAIALGHNDMR